MSGQGEEFEFFLGPLQLGQEKGIRSAQSCQKSQRYVYSRVYSDVTTQVDTRHNHI